MDLDHALSTFIFHHIFFPIKLPQEAEHDLVQLESRLIVAVRDVLQDFIQNVSPESQQRWDLALSMLFTWMKLHTEQGILQSGLEEALSNLKFTRAIACHIRAQNCGWVAFYDAEKDSVLVDAFEVSSEDGSILSSSGGLIRRFPGVGVAISADKLSDPTFCSYLATEISQLASEEVPEMLPKSKKAGIEVDEIRNTTHPGLVTEGLMTQLLALGTHHEEKRVLKCVRDEVNWKSALLPWRRSPAWLVIRVALQLVLRRCFNETEGRLHYKNFILYFMATLAARQNPSVASHELADCYEIMRARIGRRIYKLEDKDEVFSFVANRAHSASKDLLDRLMSIKKQIKITNRVRIPLIPSSSSQDDVHQSLLHCKEYLQAAMRSSPNQVKPTKFCRTHTSNLKWSNDLPIPKIGSIMALSEFEQWVDGHLQSWFINQPASKHEAACRELENTIAQYFSLAKSTYISNPQATSVMILVMLELWVVLDKMALRLCPLMKRFSPGIPDNFLEPLLLPKIGQMKRAREVEQYINVRHKESDKTNPSIFCDPAPNCFGVQFFNSSEEHQMLECRIEQSANAIRAAKQAEWERLSAQYERLHEQEQQMSHYYDYNGDDEYVHLPRDCPRCSLNKQIESISIRVHEWPLPTEDIARKTAVFELSIPIWFASWRNSTWRVLHELGRTLTVTTTDMEVRWLEYTEIQTFVTRRESNIVLASYTKSWRKSHYRSHRFPVSFDSVCIPNALRLRLFDNTRIAWVTIQTNKPSVKSMCTIQLPLGVYSNLQYTLNSTSHSQNQVIATQKDCDKKLSLLEFEAYGCLRSGENLQWGNILRNLASSALSLNEEAVVSLFKQAAWELGPLSGRLGSIRRAAHEAFEDIGFGDCLLHLLRERLVTIENNWNEYCTFDLIVTLGVRILALKSGSPSVEKVVEFLRQCREVGMDWCDQLNQSFLNKEENDDQRQQQLLLLIASTCQATYDVDPMFLDMVIETPRDLFCFVRCSILLFENSPPETDGLSPKIKLSVENSERIRSLSRSRIIWMIMNCASGLNEAIQSGMNCLEVSGLWKTCSDTWVTTETSNSAQGFGQRLHFNYLTGELLVDGNPPGRLPARFANNTLYQRLFGTRVIPVMPSSLPGASFVLSHTVENFEVHFGMQSGKLLIKTRKGSQVLQLIPHEVLERDFPRVLISENFHWLDLETGAVEFRPLNQPWKPSDRNWHLFFDPNSPGNMLMQQDSKTLVDVQSPPFQKINHILKVLDASDEIVVIRTAVGTLEAELSRLRLKFFVNDNGRVTSKEFGALIDVDQDIGCFYGLKNKLVLVDSSNNRSVIIPYGNPMISREDHHVAVTIDLPTGNRAKYMHYFLDSHLQVLRGFHPLAILYQAYLHAITSFPVPDNLTHRSGTEEAIRILRQECLKSAFPLQNDATETLERIAALTPCRRFYPQHLRVMQTIVWSSNLGQLAQHDDFQSLSQEILQFSEQFSHFHGAKKKENCLLYPGSIDLLKRNRCRAEQIMRSQFSESPTPSRKINYNSRDCNITSARSQNVYRIAALIRDWPTTVGHSSHLLATMRQFKNLATLSADFTRYSCSQMLNQSMESAWVGLYHACQTSSRATHTYFLISLFSILAFGGKIDQSVLRQLLQVAFSEKCKYIPVPLNSTTVLNLSLGGDFVLSQIQYAINTSYTTFTKVYNSHLSRAEQAKINQEAKANWCKQRAEDVRLCGDYIRAQWPSKTPVLPSHALVPLVRRKPAHEMIHMLCGDWVQNRNFLDFLRRVQKEAPPSDPWYHDVDPVPTSPVHFQEIEYSSFQPPCGFDLMHRSHPDPPQTPFAPMTYRGVSSILQSTPELWSLAKHFQASSNQCQQEYGNGLSQSVQALEDFSTSESTPGESDLAASFDWVTNGDAVLRHQEELERQRDTLWDEIVANLRTSANTIWPDTDTVSPSVTVWSVLSILASDKWTSIPIQWKVLLVAFGKSISALRRCERLIACTENRDIDGFLKEAENPGYEGWDPLNYPTWLLLEIENNITIRKRQVEVAARMIKPDCGENAVLQLNMGEGKTSVITPMVAAVLANGHDLLRIIVLKPLLRQSDALLSQRLGGLINRRIYHIPFSRQTELSSPIVSQLQSLYEQCFRQRGILIALPEQMLSFRLIGLDAVERNPNIFSPLIRLENWLQSKCRDVIDESDEVLDVKFQLIYTMGTQQSLDGLSCRWETTQNLLRLVSIQAKRLCQDDPTCIEVDQLGYRFPILRFLKVDAIERLIGYTLKSISENGIPGLPFTQWNSRVKSSVMRFIEHSELAKDDESFIREEFDGSVFMTNLLVLRGLFAYRILRFSLADKRWLVEYGLHPSRCLMAVPYRAKGIPSENSEFGHPDVAVTLTCLSYYYDGLRKEQLRDCFVLLAKENDPSTEFHNWVTQCVDDLPAGLRTYSGVNLEDDKTFTQTLFPILRYQKEIVDFYLSRFVFSREAKEFPRKLSSSAWDIPARRGLQLTTGFSGTNDNRFLLPLSIRQRDLGELLHTNAMVLGLLLREDNRQCILAQDEEGRQLDVDRLLRLVVSTGEGSPTAKPVRVLIDVGAQILEAGNQSVAQKWLAMTPEGDVEAAIFFDQSDETMVIDREGHVETLFSSSFRQRMGACLVFLDQHHSRGVDLKLPLATRAAVTLGPRLTKDRLVQACNRLRGLEKCQSLLFLVPPEVSHNMRSILGISSDRVFTSADVLKWSMAQTCQALDNVRPLWANQGLQYHKKIILWDLIVGQSDPSTKSKTASSIQEPEARTLSQLYAPWDEDRRGRNGHKMPEWNVNNEQVQELLKTLQSTSGHIATSAYLHEEQEREIACEVEREEQISRPPSYEPEDHNLHDDIRYFANFGKFRDKKPSKAVTLAFQGLENTSAGKENHPHLLGPRLYSTVDFNQTVKISKNNVMDDFSKQVNWILSSVHSDVLIIVSQYEANELINIVRKSENVRLNIYAPRLTKPMRSFRHLDFFGVGANIPMQPDDAMTRCLEMFSGSLYFGSFEDYNNFRSFLGLLTDNLGGIPDDAMTNEGFVKYISRRQLQWPIDSPFVENPLPFLGALIHIRTKGMGYQQSHVGTLVKAMPLSAERF
ncbi:hypothetical protein LCP9604111_359 [Penicillium roqueforti]|uniref:uncharacterized protein n=1 Tax=Penicillium roqueforti TaxID=5082 RepID=UPI00190CD13C|nr:uncharacterized protein LCP9604111_359 [Penicillium roqueforti]KAF9252833.1 hypothetical protein LCP9604111_359 [Penicillium roqueforti]KAI2724156.1 hypothetical protein CBS147318_1087 [Penicillium roqueforti]KAI3132924.1 hypothetical protein CBS147330_4108 [Penicillium roqueforti]KAI3168758.1 hypothetical protein DTO039G3_5626 [Penicillium roqueforti]KAI3230034.1 hypothetical protein CBS147310_6601 [Penicillium roqueforti]